MTPAGRVARDVVRVSGADARTFLQGQLSQDLDPLASGGSTWSLVLQPQGKVEALVRVTRTDDDEYLLDVDAGFGDAVGARLDRFLLRVDAVVEPLRGEWSCAIDDAAASALGAFAPVEERAADMDGNAWDAIRVRLGIPAMGSELTDATIPEEAGIVDATVSFTKGCYTGQELVARVDSRGRNVPRRLRRLVAVAGQLHAGDELVVGGKVVGRVTTAAGDAALGYVRRDVEPPAEVSSAGGGVTRVEALPPVT